MEISSAEGLHWHKCIVDLEVGTELPHQKELGFHSQWFTFLAPASLL